MSMFETMVKKQQEIEQLKKDKKSLIECLEQFIYSVENEGVVNGRVIDAVENAKELIK